jgi:hypothetical protein
MVNLQSAKIFCAFAFGLLAQGSFAAEVSCPGTIDVHDSLVAEAPMGWTARKGATTKFLSGISLYDGNPERGLSVAPTTDRRAATGRQASWILPAKSSTWLVCRYVGTGATLTKEMDDAFRKCSLLYGPGGAVQRLTCE